jgi:hypothetical protein
MRPTSRRPSGCAACVGLRASGSRTGRVPVDCSSSASKLAAYENRQCRISDEVRGQVPGLKSWRLGRPPARGRSGREADVAPAIRLCGVCWPAGIGFAHGSSSGGPQLKREQARGLRKQTFPELSLFSPARLRPVGSSGRISARLRTPRVRPPSDRVFGQSRRFGTRYGYT